MMRRFTCEHCEEGKVECSRYGGNDPDTWFRVAPCEECDGEGNVLVHDEGLVIGEIVTQYDRDWYMRQSPRQSMKWTAIAAGCQSNGSTEAGAVRGLIEELAAAADEREYERQCAEEEIAA